MTTDQRDPSPAGQTSTYDPALKGWHNPDGSFTSAVDAQTIVPVAAPKFDQVNTQTAQRNAQGVKGPGIPGDDIPLTKEEEEHFDQLANKLINAEKQKRFTPPPISGYRTLSQFEVDMINAIKGEGVVIENLYMSVVGYLHNQRREASRLSPVQAMDSELRRIDRAQGERWAAIARTHFQEGLMALTRAVAQPSNF